MGLAFLGWLATAISTSGIGAFIGHRIGQNSGYRDGLEQGRRIEQMAQTRTRVNQYETQRTRDVANYADYEVQRARDIDVYQHRNQPDKHICTPKCPSFQPDVPYNGRWPNGEGTYGG